MKKLLLTFLFCMIGFSCFSDEVFQCRTKSVDIKHDFEVRNFVDEKYVGMRIVLDKDRIVISEMTTNSGNKISFFRINDKSDYKIEAEACLSVSKRESCGWNSRDEKIYGETAKVLRRQTLTFFREQKVGTIFYDSNNFGVGIRKLICSQI